MPAEETKGGRKIGPQAREIVKDLARRSGLTLGEWLNRMIVEGEGADHPGEPQTVQLEAGMVEIRPSKGRARPGAGGQSPADSESLEKVAEHLNSRIQAADQRMSLAFSGLDQSLRGVLSRLNSLERELKAATPRSHEALRDPPRQAHSGLSPSRQADDERGGRPGSPTISPSDKVVGMTGEITREEIAASLAAVEARTDTKIAIMNGRLDVIVSKIDDVREGQRTSFWGVLGAIAAALAVTVGCLAFGSQWFGLGLDSGAALEAAAQRGAARALEAQRAESPPPIGLGATQADPMKKGG